MMEKKKSSTGSSCASIVL